jgi:signal transduction histidine kinase/ligand-binding sensor domain-containing protein
MKTFFLLLFFYLFFISNKSLAQMPEFIFRNISTEHGLPENIVLDIKEDALGFIWIATPNYLSRFDGVNLKAFPKAFDYRTDPENFKLGKILVNGDQIWLITKGGKLEVLDLITEKFHSIYYLNDSIPIPELRSFYISLEKEIILGSEKQGVFLVDGGFNILKHYHQQADNPNNQIVSDKINGLHQDQMGRIWILTDKGISRIENGYVSSILNGIHTTTLFEDNDFSAVVIGTIGNTYYFGSIILDNLSKPAHSNKQTIKEDMNIYALYLDSNRRLWSGSLGKGAFVVNHGGNYEIRQLLQNKGKSNTLADNTILCMYGNGKDGGLWIGTDGGGISFFDEGPDYFKDLKHQLFAEDISLRHVTSIQKDENKILWISSLSDGLIAVDSMYRLFKRVNLMDVDPVVFKNNRVLDFYINDQVYLGTSAYGLLILDKETFRLKSRLHAENNTLPGNRIKSIKPFNDSILVILNLNSVSLLNKKTLKSQIFHFPIEDEFTVIEPIDEVNFALATEKSGIFILNIHEGRFNSISKAYYDEHLWGSAIHGLHYKNGWLWATAYDKGLWALEMKTQKSRIFSQKDGIPAGINYGIIPEDSRTLWISHSKGIYKLTYEKIDVEISIEKINPYQQLNKFEIYDYNSKAHFTEEDGNIYIGGISSLIYFDPEKIPLNKKEVKIVLTGIKVNNQMVESNKAHPYLTALDLKHFQNSLEIDFAALNSSLSDELEFSYRLLGFEEEWVSIENRNFVSFTNLNPGNYTFQIKLADTSIESSPITSLQVRIQKAFYQEFWFKALVVSAIFALFYVFYRLRIRHLLEMQEIKEGISADLHDDLGSRLTTINLLSAISKGKFRNEPEIKSLLAQIDREVNASSEALHEIVGNIKMQDVDFEDFLAKIRRHISEILDPENIKYSIVSDDNIQFGKISMRKRREIFLVVKELVNNIRKHAKALKVNFEIGEREGFFYLSVQDDGVGFDPRMDTHRNGIKNLRLRVEKWKGKLTIHSQGGKGSKIETWIPFDRLGFWERFIKVD